MALAPTSLLAVLALIVILACSPVTGYRRRASSQDAASPSSSSRAVVEDADATEASSAPAASPAAHEAYEELTVEDLRLALLDRGVQPAPDAGRRALAKQLRQADEAAPNAEGAAGAAIAEPDRRATGLVLIAYCPWSTTDAFESLQTAIVEKYPNVRVTGEATRTEMIRDLAARALITTAVTGIAIAIFGRRWLPEAMRNALNDNRFAYYAVLYGLYNVGVYLSRSNAFEIAVVPGITDDAAAQLATLERAVSYPGASIVFSRLGHPKHDMPEVEAVLTLVGAAFAKAEPPQP